MASVRHDDLGIQQEKIGHSKVANRGIFSESGPVSGRFIPSDTSRLAGDFTHFRLTRLHVGRFGA
jgi:hypothetical protein